MEAQVKIIDTATPHFARLASEAPAQFRRALKSAGWWLREEIKAGIREGAPGGAPYAPFSAVTRGKLLRRPGQRRSEHRPMGRLQQATIYRYYADSMRVLVGWVTRTAEQVGLKQEHGHETEITPRMRRFFWASGVPLRASTRILAIPRRPTIDPEYRENAARVPAYMEGKIAAYLAGSEATR